MCSEEMKERMIESTKGREQIKEECVCSFNLSKDMVWSKVEEEMFMLIVLTLDRIRTDTYVHVKKESSSSWDDWIHVKVKEKKQ